MKRIASARLLRSTPRAHLCVLEIVELDLPAGGDPAQRHIVTLRQGALSGGVMLAPTESSLTVRPCSADEAERRAVDFIRRRVAAGDVLEHSEGFATALVPPVATAAPTPAASPATGLPPAIAALVARFDAARWPLLSPRRQSRSAWRVAECSDPVQGGAAQRALVALVPRLVDLLESGDDMLDLCLAAAIARLGDPGAAVAMQALAGRGRSEATRRFAHQAWLMLQAPAALQAHADTLLPGWQATLDDTATGAERVTALQALLDARNTDWRALLPAWYDIALARPQARAGLLALLPSLPLAPGCFIALRRLYKAAELRRDEQVIALLHARFENTPPYFLRGPYTNPKTFIDPATQRRVKTPIRTELAAENARLAWSNRTRDHLRRRGWRTLRRLAALQHGNAPRLAVQMLLALDDAELPPAARESRVSWQNRAIVTTVRHFHPAARWLLVRELLLARHPDVRMSARATRWWTTEPLPDGAVPAARVDGLAAMWDAHPDALLTLALHSRCALVHGVVARALQDHAAFVAQQPADVLAGLLQSRYGATARTGFDAVRSRVQQAASPAEQVPWLVLLTRSSDEAAREFAFVHIAANPAGFAAHPPLVAALLLSPHERSRQQGHGLALIAGGSPLVAELQSALLAVDAEQPGLDDALALLDTLLAGPLAAAAAQAAVEPLLCLLDHPHDGVLQFAVGWLLRHPHAATLVPPTTLAHLLAEAAPLRRAAGVRLLAALPDSVLATQGALLCELAVNGHAAVREAVAPALRRLAAADPAFAATLAHRLHAALFATETGDGLHAQALAWLSTDLQAVAPARDPSGAWRALQAQSRGAQAYGAWALQALQPAGFSLKQLATIVRHAELSARQWAMAALDARLPPGAAPSTDEAAELLPLADAWFDDARAYAHAMFGERLPDASLSTELLIAWVDHPQPWVQALGRQRLVRRMAAGEASLCLTRLSQHPGTQVQLFVTQWLLELPRDDAAELAARLRELMPYFITVLSQVHRGRTAKSRVIAFLREAGTAAEPAAVVAEIFARQVVTSSLTDKPQYIAGLRDIAARHPQIALPFMAWNALPTRAAQETA